MLAAAGRLNRANYENDPELAKLLAVVPFVIIPVAIGTAVTLLLVNIFPARRASRLNVLEALQYE